MIRIPAHSRSLVALFALTGSCVGLAAGFFEAALLSSRPPLPMLRRPDVGYCIWLLAPLVDLSAFGFIGLTLGLGARIWRPTTAWRIATLVAIGLGAVGAFIVHELIWPHYQFRGPSLRVRKIAALMGAFVAVCGVALLVFKTSWSRIESFFSPEKQWPIGPLAKTLLVVTGVLTSGLGFYFISFSAASPSAKAGSFQPGGRPNIVLISLDTVRADHLSLYGYTRPTTPNLDRLAQQGVLFENAIAPSSWTGYLGTSAASTMRTLLAFNPAETCASFKRWSNPS